MVVLVVVVASSTVTRQGVSLKNAQACAKGTAECLPGVDYLDTEDNLWTAQSLAGKVVIVNFWATWCRPCQMEIPALTAAYEKYAKDGLVLLGVMTDEVDDHRLQTFAEEHGLRYPVVRADPEVWHAFEGPDALPTTFIYDRSGSVRLRHRGPLSESDLDDILTELIAEKAPLPAGPAAAR